MLKLAKNYVGNMKESQLSKIFKEKLKKSNVKTFEPKKISNPLLPNVIGVKKGTSCVPTTQIEKAIFRMGIDPNSNFNEIKIGIILDKIYDQKRK